MSNPIDSDFNFSELENESDCIIYTTDIHAVWSVIHLLSDMYEHRESQYESTPYEMGSQEDSFTERQTGW